MSTVVAALLLACALQPASAAVLRLPGYYGDNMLFQRDQPMVLRGWADSGARVQLSDGEHRSVVDADAQGHWIGHLPPHAAATALTLTISSGSERIVLSNVAVGELWLGAGQSNMAWPMGFIAARLGELQQVDDPDVRVMSVRQSPWRLPVDDVDGVWYSASPDSVRDFSAVAYHFAHALHRALGVPVGVINASWGGSRIEPWMPMAAYAGVAPQMAQQTESLNSRNFGPAALYNGMIYPLGTLPLRGVLWYQGESNLLDGPAYLPKLRALIESWRQLWGGEMPFYFAQIAPMDYSPCAEGLLPDLLPEFWEMQQDALAIPATAMATTLDLNPDAKLHPDQKREVGERFAALALQHTYGRNVRADSPRYLKHIVSGRYVRIEWQHAEGLHVTGEAAVAGFELAGADGVFHPAHAVLKGGAVVAAAPEVAHPVAVRYAWTPTPEISLVNAAGLPALPFRAPRPPLDHRTVAADQRAPDPDENALGP